ncbi:orotate phosphoribosyltransferase [Larkinella harenae]
MIAEQIARLLLEVKAVRLRPNEPFTWSSGWKSPIYCDNRITLSHPEARTYIRNELANAIRRDFPDVQAIAGVATAGIPQGALVADALNLPFLYVRPEPKKHGMGNQIEGRLEAGQRIVVIEDLISTGGSSLKVVDVLRQSEAEVLGMVAIFTYGFPIAAQNFADKDVKLTCLSDYETLIGEARNLNYIAADATDSLAAWRENPAEWNQ